MLIEKYTKDNLDENLIKNVVKSYNNYYELNNYEEDIGSLEHKKLWEILGVNSLYTVIKDNRFLGFFILKIHTTNQEISFQIFLSPLACPKSNMSLIKAAMSKSFSLFLQYPEKYKHFEFISGHPILVTTVKTLLPKISSYMINPNHIVCYKEIKEEDLLYIKNFLTSYTKTDDYKYNSYELLR